jgi:hypothetical protein
VASLESSGQLLVSQGFFPDGDTLTAIEPTGVLHLWSAPSWKVIEATEAKEKAEAKQRAL